MCGSHIDDDNSSSSLWVNGERYSYSRCINCGQVAPGQQGGCTVDRHIHSTSRTCQDTWRFSPGFLGNQLVHI